MCKKTCIVVFSVLGLFLLPIALNFILVQPRFCQNVIGDATVWLSFWGSYIGGVLTALIGMITLFVSNQKQNLQLQIEQKRSELERLEALLAESVSIFDISKLANIVLYLGHLDTDFRLIMAEYDSYYTQVLQKTNSYGLKFGDNPNASQYQVDFSQKYALCSQYTIQLITELQSVLYRIKNSTNQAELESQIETLAQISGRHAEYKEYYVQPLYEAAQRWIRAEQEIVRILENKL